MSSLEVQLNLVSSSSVFGKGNGGSSSDDDSLHSDREGPPDLGLTDTEEEDSEDDGEDQVQEAPETGNAPANGECGGQPPSLRAVMRGRTPRVHFDCRRKYIHQENVNQHFHVEHQPNALDVVEVVMGEGNAGEDGHQAHGNNEAGATVANGERRGRGQAASSAGAGGGGTGQEAAQDLSAAAAAAVTGSTDGAMGPPRIPRRRSSGAVRRGKGMPRLRRKKE